MAVARGLVGHKRDDAKMFLLKRPIQLIINIAIVLLVVGFIATGAAMVLPARSPVGPLLGKFASDTDLLSNMLKSTQPKAVAQALNENPAFLSELLSTMESEGTVPVIAKAINENPAFLTAAVPYFDPQVIAGVVNKSTDMIIKLVAELDPGVIAEAVNQNGPFLSQLLTYLDRLPSPPESIKMDLLCLRLLASLIPRW